MFSRLAGGAIPRVSQTTMVLMLLSSLVWGARGPRPLPQEEDVFARGVQAYSAGDYSKAEKLLATYLKANPTGLIRDIGMLWYGRSLLALNHVDDAQKVIQNMLKEFPNSPLTQKLRDELQSHAQSNFSGKSGKPELAKPLDAKAELKQLKQEAAKRQEALKTPSPLPSSSQPVKRERVQRQQVAQNRKAESPAQAAEPNPQRFVQAEKTAARREKKASEKGHAAASPAVAKKKIELDVSEKGTSWHSWRDPFRALVVQSSNEPPPNLPPGKKGLLVERLQLKGIVRSGADFLAITQSGTDAAAIFLRVGDQLYDGEVQKIYEDRVVFKHVGMDKLGKSYLEEVTKRLTGSGIF